MGRHKGAAEYIGLSNYKELFITDANGMKFDGSIVNSLVMAAMMVFLQLPMALLLALVLAHGVKGERVFRTIYFIPVVISSASIGVMFLKIYNPDFGVLNVLLDKVGLAGMKRDWLTDERTGLDEPGPPCRVAIHRLSHAVDICRDKGNPRGALRGGDHRWRLTGANGVLDHHSAHKADAQGVA